MLENRIQLITILKGTTKQFSHRLTKSPVLHKPVTKDFFSHNYSFIFEHQVADSLKLNLNLTFLLYKDCINSAFHFFHLPHSLSNLIFSSNKDTKLLESEMFLVSLATKPDLSSELLQTTRLAFLRITAISIQQTQHDNATSLSSVKKKNSSLSLTEPISHPLLLSNTTGSPRIGKTKIYLTEQNQKPSTMGFFLNMELLAHLVFLVSQD